jgi:hypothetical protein
VLRLRDASSIRVENAALEPLFTSWLATRLRMPVIDRTGLSGGYNFDLRWESEMPGDDALEEALLTQLGLTLETIETDVERMVVDRVSRPVDLEASPIEVAIDADVLDRYVGHYALPGASLMSISRDGAMLLSRLMGQAPVEIFPTSETDFFVKAFPARVRFVVDGQGRAIALTLYQSGREIQAPRIGDAEAQRWIDARDKRG